MDRKTRRFDFSNVGPEDDNHARLWQNAMDDVRIEVDYADLKGSFLEWARLNREADELAHWESLPNWQYAMLGRITYCMQHGAVPPDDTMTWFQGKVQDLSVIADGIDQVEAEPDRKLSVTQRRNIDYVNHYSRIDSIWTANLTDISAIEDSVRRYLTNIGPNQQMLRRLYDHFKEGFNDAMRGKDNPHVLETIEPLLTVVNVLALSTGNAKAVSESRGATSRSIKQASKAKFKSVDLDTSVASLNPAMVPGSKVLLVYNAKNRKLAMYTAEDGVLGIKGTKITGYDENKSYAKTLRKPKSILPTIRDAANQKRIEVVLGDYVKGKKHSVTGRLTKDTLLIKVFK